MTPLGQDADSGPLFVIAGGGTAGHVMPGLAVAEAIVEAGHPKERVHFIGARRGMEATMVPAAGYSVSLFDVRGIARSMSPSNLPAFYNLLAGIRRADRLFRRIEPSVVVSVGGYASVPAVVAAKVQRIPVLVVSYDVVPGKASRLAARLATASAVAFESSSLPRKVVTGVPLRLAILAVDRDRDRVGARLELGLPPDRFTVVIVGGSLGSGALNTVARDLVAARRDDAGLAVHHVYGSRNKEETWEPLDAPEGLVYHPVPFEDRMDLAYAAADLVVARAGATTVAELAALGVPSILVPWPLAAADHQTANARALAAAGGALLVPEPQLDADRIGRELDRLRADPSALDALSAGARSIGRRGAAAAVARLAEELATERAAH
jgi:UDP-N-acetylglucosamine--N-acetylmuramyl-(pentapeptide) pyrophosphoryl-undecaprenol N-acetylglucosamine transferase